MFAVIVFCSLCRLTAPDPSNTWRRCKHNKITGNTRRAVSPPFCFRWLFCKKERKLMPGVREDRTEKRRAICVQLPQLKLGIKIQSHGLVVFGRRTWREHTRRHPQHCTGTKINNRGWRTRPAYIILHTCMQGSTAQDTNGQQQHWYRGNDDTAADTVGCTAPVLPSLAPLRAPKTNLPTKEATHDNYYAWSAGRRSAATGKNTAVHT